jgi:thiamine-phosphate pyrophosphorylase
MLDAVLGAGAPLVQLRAKGCPDGEFYELALGAGRRCREAGASFVVNDRVDIALAVAADGAHLGQEDLPIAEARRLLGPSAVLGASVYTVAEANEAVAAGATYLGAGPCYPTSTKPGLPASIGPAGLATIAHAVSVPVVAIGGIEARHVPELLAAGAYGVAVISAIACAADPAQAAREILGSLHGAGERGTGQ